MANRSEAQINANGEAFSTLRPLLGPGVTRDVIARGSRDAALAFCRGARAGWTRRELADWLTGPYQTVAGLVDHVVLPRIEPSPPSTMRSTDVVTDETIASLLEAAERSALACVEAIVRGEGDRYVEAARERGGLVDAVTVRGEVLVVPIHRPRMRLARRVGTLFLADYALRPDDYADCKGTLHYCDVCGVVLLGAGAIEHGLCGLHARRSGIVSRLEEGSDVAGDLSVDVDLSDLGA